MGVAPSLCTVLVKFTMDVHSLCQEYVNGHSTPETPKQIAKGEFELSPNSTIITPTSIPFIAHH